MSIIESRSDICLNTRFQKHVEFHAAFKALHSKLWLRFSQFTIHMERNRNSVESKISPSLLFLAVVSNIKDKKDCKSFWQTNWSYCGKRQKSSHSSSAGKGRWHNLKPQPWQNRRDGCSPSRLFSDLRHVESTLWIVLQYWGLGYHVDSISVSINFGSSLTYILRLDKACFFLRQTEVTKDWMTNDPSEIW